MPESVAGTIVLIPVFNDWEPAGILLGMLDQALRGHGLAPQVLLVNDGSTVAAPAGFAAGPFSELRRVAILHLRRNLGHQRAIAVGLVYIHDRLPCRAVVVMDGDGEDLPSDIPALAAKFEREQGRAIIFAARAKRLERWLFRVLYRVYRGLHWALTGDEVRVGNFSMLPFDSLRQLAVLPEIWNHYAAAVIRSRLAFQSIPIARGRRLAGQSKMNFIALLLHGLSAFFVYGEIVGARLLVAIALALGLELVLVASAVAVQMTTSFSVLRMAAYVAALLGILLIQAIPIALILVFTVVGSRANVGFLPLRDCPYFVDRLEQVYTAP